MAGLDRRAAAADRGIHPTIVELGNFSVTSDIRSDPRNGNVSLLDCVKNVTVTDSVAKTIVKRHFGIAVDIDDQLPAPAPDPKRPRNLYAFFGAPVSGPSSGGVAPVVQHKFGANEIVHTASDAKGRQYILSKVKPDGSLVAQCSDFKNHRSPASRASQPMANFFPRESFTMGPARAECLAAEDAYNEALLAGDLDAARAARARIEAARLNTCPKCIKTHGDLSPLQQELKANTERLYSPEVIGTCKVCGEQPATEYNHLPGKPKTFAISDYQKWKSVAAQNHEAEHSCNEVCHPCHRLDELSCSSNRVGDPRDMPRGKRRGTEEERQQYHRRWHAKIKWPKYLILDRIKIALETGPDSAKRAVAALVSNAREANTRCFDFDHPDRDGVIGGEEFKKRTHTWMGKGGKKKVKRMSPSLWANLGSKEHILSKIWEELRDDVLRTWMTDCGIHMSFKKTPRTNVTLEALLAERARVEERIQWVLDTFYDGEVTEAHDYHSDGDVEGDEGEGEGEGEGSEGDGEGEGEGA